MSSIDALFVRLRAAGQKALVPFVTAGDPDLDFTAAVIAELVARGAHLCEVGIPYSDPIADGPVIQASYTRALANKIKLAQIVDMLGRASPRTAAPLVTMVSYAIIHRHGLARFVDEARAAGVAGAIVPDLLIEEAGELAAVCRRADFSLVQLVAPTTPRERARRIADSSTGFLYYVSVTGTTGERTSLPQSLLDDVGWLRERTSTPICIGFGISTPEHVRLLAPVVDGLIVGSALVRRIATAASRPPAEVLREVGDYTAELLAALREREK
ncbi:MAG TPA: tryptophan synthase subunit alpha [Pirellulales bacterium]|nr:tryptophan synthase subunit alpha [Pirellulales bacterium]